MTDDAGQCEQVTAMLAEALARLKRVDARAAELGSPRMTRYREPMLRDFANAVRPLAMNCMELLQMLESFCRASFAQPDYYVVEVCPRVARVTWFEEEQ